MKKRFIQNAGLALLCLAIGTTVCAQSLTIDFEDVTIPEGFPSVSKSITPEDDYVPYQFTASGLVFRGTQAPWNAYSGFDCSRGTDSTDYSYANDYSAITAQGFEGSVQYAVAYLNQLYPDNPANTEPLGLRLADDTVQLLGLYVTNTTLTYKYIQSNWEKISQYQLVINGYLAGEPVEETIYFDLAKKDGDDTMLVRDWTFIDLEPLGNIDSITFALYSDDISYFTPFYFALDQIIFKDQSAFAPDIMPTASFVKSYPNPANDLIHIETSLQGNLQYSIADLHGKIVLQGSLHERTISIATLPSGVYVLTLNNTLGQTSSLKIQKI